MKGNHKPCVCVGSARAHSWPAPDPMRGSGPGMCPMLSPCLLRAQYPSGAEGRAPFCSCQRWDTSCTCCLTCRSPCKHEKTTARRALAASLWKQHEDGLTFPILAWKRQKDSGSLHAVLRALLGHFPTVRFKALKPAG